jgi:retinol dehydrogenase 14
MTDTGPALSMTGKFCMITGANSGIGKPTALALAEMGATVVMVCRNRDTGEEALREIRQRTGNRSSELLTADLSSQAAIRNLAAEFTEKHDRLDVLVNNAGVVMRKRVLTVDGIETTFAVNHLAYFLLTNLLLEVLRKSAPARIVNVASAAHASGTMNFDDLSGENRYSSWGAYCQSKLANILFTYELARKLAGSGVTVNCLHPGVIATGLFRNLPKIIDLPARLFLTRPEKGAETSIYLATSPEVEGVTGRYFARKRATNSSAESNDREEARRLWQVSEKLTA